MDQRGYQPNFSEKMLSMYDLEGRERKARTIEAVLKDHFGPRFQNMDLLDVGSSTGAIPNFLAGSFRTVAGIDIDTRAVGHAAKNYRQANLEFFVADSMNLPFSPQSFDVVICAQVYEHVPDAWRMMAEIERVLKPGGVCFFSAGNRLQIVEPHYRLPFLSWLPGTLANRYVRFAGKAPFYYEKHLSCRGLKHLVKQFRRIDYTSRIIENPSKYELSYLLPEGSIKARMARLISRHFYFLCPGYIWLLEKTPSISSL